MKPFKCDLCSEELDSRRQAFKHLNKVHGGAGTVSSCLPTKDSDQFETTTSLGSASQHFLIVPNDGSEDQFQDNSGDLVYESDSDVKVKEECTENEEGLIIPDDEKDPDEDLVGMDVSDQTPDLERDPLSPFDSEEDSEQQTNIPTQQANSMKAAQRNSLSIEDIAKNIIVQNPPELETNLDGETCPKCEKSFKSTKDMRSHYRLAHVKRYQCTLCLRKFTSRVNVRKHVCIQNYPDSKKSSRVAEHHRPNEVLQNKAPPPSLERTISNRKGKIRKSFKCKLCGQHFPDIHKYRRHHEDVHLKLRFICELCNKSFTESGSLTRHKRREHPAMINKHSENQAKPEDSDSACICDLCKLGYNCASILKEGKPVYLTGGEHPCDVCGKQFDADGKLRRHRMERHPPGLRFFCGDGCGESFVFRRKLVLHQESCPIYKKEYCEISVNNSNLISFKSDL